VSLLGFSFIIGSSYSIVLACIVFTIFKVKEGENGPIHRFHRGRKDRGVGHNMQWEGTRLLRIRIGRKEMYSYCIHLHG
jgi:hypothetical protein